MSTLTAMDFAQCVTLIGRKGTMTAGVSCKYNVTVVRFGHINTCKNFGQTNQIQALTNFRHCY